MRTLLAFTKRDLEDVEAQIQSPIGENLRDMLHGFHLELLRHSSHPLPEDAEPTRKDETTAADAKPVSWTEKLLSLIISKQEEKPTGPITDGPGICRRAADESILYY